MIENLDERIALRAKEIKDLIDYMVSQELVYDGNRENIRRIHLKAMIIDDIEHLLSDVLKRNKF